MRCSRWSQCLRRSRARGARSSPNCSRIDGRAARAVAYRIAVAGGEAMHAVAWIDAEAYLPLRWELRRAAIDRVITQAVTGSAIDGEIDPRAFTIPGPLGVGRGGDR